MTGTKKFTHCAMSILINLLYEKFYFLFNEKGYNYFIQNIRNKFFSIFLIKLKLFKNLILILLNFFYKYSKKVILQKISRLRIS